MTDAIVFFLKLMRRDFLIGFCFLERTHLWLTNSRSHLLGQWVYWSTKKNVNIDLCHCKSQMTNLWEVGSVCVATGIQQPFDTLNQSNYKHLYSRTLPESNWASVECSTEQCYRQIRSSDPTPHWNMQSLNVATFPSPAKPHSSVWIHPTHFTLVACVQCAVLTSFHMFDVAL